MAHPRDDLLAEIARLRNRVDELEAEVAFCHDQLAVPDAEYVVARLLGMPKWLVPALHLFVVRQVVPTDALTAIGDDLEWTTAEKYPHFAVHRLRRHLIPNGINIETVWGFGYKTSPDNHARLKALVH